LSGVLELPLEGNIPADETLADEDEPANGEETLSPEQRRIELEIKSSTLPELAAWSRSLGLSEGGTREDISRRIREYFQMPQPKEQDDDSRKIITIESAQTTEYFTLEVVDEDYARLRGGVVLRLTDNDSVHRIMADEVLFNRTRNILTARGGVQYIRERGDTIETFRGEHITVNIDNWSSIFLDGISERRLESDGTAYRFAGTVISRNNGEDVMILNNAEISNAYNEEALWSISASKLILLPGSDFWIFNAVLKVGEIPVLYIPFFFFPADEVIFHPVIGYRSREGAFAQTTYYVWGRPTANPADSSSLSRILGNSNDMEKERQGLFLRSTGSRIRNPDTTSLKVMLDYYTNLGFYLGLDLATPRTGILNPLNLSLGIGFTRTITLEGGNYTIYAPNYDGSYEWNESNLFSQAVPFRYRMSTQSSISGRYGSLAWNIPFYSDPYVDRDFLNRSESMDWVNMIQQGATLNDSAASDSSIGSYQWQINGNLNPSFPVLSPYISNISLSNLSMTLAFKTIRDNEIFARNSDHPGRFFFAPDKYTIYSISGIVSGTPLSISGANQTISTSANNAVTETEDPLKGIGIPRPPWPQENNNGEKQSTNDQLIPPVLNLRFDLPGTGNVKYSVDYQLSPTSSTELQFMSGYDRWKSFDQVDWNDVQSILSSIGGNGNVNFRADHSAGFFTNTITFSASGTWRDYSYLNSEAEAFRTPQTADGEIDESRIEEARRQQYRQTNYSTSYAYNGTLRPLYNNPVFGQSNLQYTFRSTLVRSRRYTDGNGPELTPQWGIWAKEQTRDGEDTFGFSSHRFSTNIAANIMNMQQNISFNADLPPLDGLISTNATFRVWISETDMNIQFKKPEMIDNEPNNEWKIDPFNFTQTFRFAGTGSFIFRMITDPQEKNEITTITSSLTLWDFTASFSAVKTKKYEFVPDYPDDPSMGGRWVQQDEEASLNPRDLIFSYNRTFSNIEIIRDRMNFSLNLNARLFFDLLRPTSSNFQFSMGFTLGIAGFLDLSLRATSENAAIFRYFKGVPGMEGLTSMYIGGDQNNPLIDFFDSFNFADEAKRRRSGFKMKTFNLTATHHLGDWKAVLGIAMTPYLNNSLDTARYEINTDISFLVQWYAISEIKSDINYEKRTERWTIR
jgi:lipopolysaccharide assembly outer membrane protein LptD (OstA)